MCLKVTRVSSTLPIREHPLPCSANMFQKEGACPQVFSLTSWSPPLSDWKFRNVRTVAKEQLLVLTYCWQVMPLNNFKPSWTNFQLYSSDCINNIIIFDSFSCISCMWSVSYLVKFWFKSITWRYSMKCQPFNKFNWTPYMVANLLQVLSKSQNWPAGPWPNQSFWQSNINKSFFQE